MDAAEEAAFLLAAVREAVERTSIQAVAKESGVSHGGIFNLANGRTRRLYGTTLGKLRNGYLQQWTSAGDGLTSDVAAYLVEQLLVPVPPGERSGALLELAKALVGIYERHGTRRPEWLDSVTGQLV